MRLGFGICGSLAVVVLGSVACSSGALDNGDADSRPASQASEVVSHATVEVSPSIARGGCSDADRANYIYGGNHQFAAVWRQCGVSSWGDPAKTQACIVTQFTALSTSCADCFGSFTRCGTEHCFTKCALAPYGNACATCSENACISAWTQCAGLSSQDLPR